MKASRLDSLFRDKPRAMSLVMCNRPQMGTMCPDDVREESNFPLKTDLTIAVLTSLSNCSTTLHGQVLSMSSSGVSYQHDLFMADVHVIWELLCDENNMRRFFWRLREGPPLQQVVIVGWSPRQRMIRESRTKYRIIRA